MSQSDENWLILSKGIEIPGFNVVVPWQCSESDLFQLIPRHNFTFSSGGHWPMLHFKLFGFSATWGFNFVSAPSGCFSELQFRNDKPFSPKRTYRRSWPKLLKALGCPNIVNHGRWGQQTWHVGGVWVDNNIASSTRLPSNEVVPVHFLSIRSMAAT